MDYIQILSAAGIGGTIGSLLTTLVQAWITNKQHLNNRFFQAKKEAYIGLADALRLAAVEGSDKAAKNFAYWQLRCDLVAPREVRKAIQELIDTNENMEARDIAFEKLIEVLQKDLGIEN